jgi:hypothetical protein
MKHTTTTLASALALFLSLAQPVLARPDNEVRNDESQRIGRSLSTKRQLLTCPGKRTFSIKQWTRSWITTMQMTASTIWRLHIVDRVVDAARLQKRTKGVGAVGAKWQLCNGSPLPLEMDLRTWAL